MAKEQGQDHTTKTPVAKECVCDSEYQDKRYGKHQRLMNPMKGGKYRCTVCRREHD